MIGGIQSVIEANSPVIGLLILVVMFVEFVRERYPVSVVAVLGASAFLLFGLLDTEGMLSVFSNPAPITIAAMFIISGSLVRTGAIDAIARTIVARAKRHPRLAVVEVLGGALIASAFMNNTPVVVVLIPIMYRLAAATGIPVKKLMMPLSIVAVLGGTMTLIGTSTNLVVDGLARDAGMQPFGIFEITPYGLIVSLVGAAVLLILGPLLLPSDPPSTRAGDEADTGEYLTDLVLRNDSPLVGRYLSASPLLRKRLAHIVGIKRGSEMIRRKLGELVLTGGDRIVMRIAAADVMTLRLNRNFDVGVSRSSEPQRKEDKIVEAMVSPTHPSIGGRLTDIPFLNRTSVRVLGVMRFRHLAGPDLGNTRLRAADRLLICGDERSIRRLRENPYLLGVDQSRTRAFRPNRAPIAIAALAATVALSALDLVSITVAAILAVATLLVTRCIDPEEAWGSVDGDVLILIFAMLAVGIGLEQAGSVRLMVEWITPVMVQAPPWALVFIVYTFTILLSELLSNNAVAAILTPLVIELARDIGTDPRPLVIALMIGASACFATPVGYQTNALVYAAADYRFSDFVRIGMPLNFIVGLAACLSITFIY